MNGQLSTTPQLSTLTVGRSRPEAYLRARNRSRSLPRRVARFSKRPISAWQSRRKISDLVNNGQEIKIEVGAGVRRGTDGWLTVDQNSSCDICWDLRRGIPFPRGSVSELYSSHFLEHLTYSETQDFLDECLRVLHPGATFSVCVPNARLYLEAYLGLRELDRSLFLRHAPAYNGTTRIDVVNYTAYMAGEHKYMWDEENLLHVLSAKGFRNVRLRDFDSTLDLPARDYESIYAIATR